MLTCRIRITEQKRFRQNAIYKNQEALKKRSHGVVVRASALPRSYCYIFYGPGFKTSWHSVHASFRRYAGVLQARALYSFHIIIQSHFVSQ